MYFLHDEVPKLSDEEHNKYVFAAYDLVQKIDQKNSQNFGRHFVSLALSLDSGFGRGNHFHDLQ